MHFAPQGLYVDFGRGAFQSSEGGGGAPGDAGSGGLIAGLALSSWRRTSSSGTASSSCSARSGTGGFAVPDDDDIVVTPEMISAGASVASEYAGEVSDATLAEWVFLAMIHAKNYAQNHSENSF
jgi:hypothetical protein